MTIMHVFSLADSRHWHPRDTQLREHTAIPWDEAYDLYLDPTALDALFALATAAAKAAGAAGAESRLKGRVFDVLRAVKNCDVTTHTMARRDFGPLAVVTSSAVLHRIELEVLLDSWGENDWHEARQLGRKLVTLTHRAGDKI